MDLSNSWAKKEGSASNLIVHLCQRTAVRDQKIPAERTDRQHDWVETRDVKRYPENRISVLETKSGSTPLANEIQIFSIFIKDST